MDYYPHHPLVVQSDLSIFVEVNHPEYPTVRDTLKRFSDLIKSPEYIHTYKITPLSLWNAASSGLDSDEVIRFLSSYAKFPLPSTVKQAIQSTMDRFGKMVLRQSAEGIELFTTDPSMMEELAIYPSLSSFFVQNWVEQRENQRKVWIRRIVEAKRGELKQELLKIGYPVKDEAGYIRGDQLTLQWKSVLPTGEPFELRDYQREAAEAFHQHGSQAGGHGVLVLPCGAGKTIIGIECMIALQCATLILTTNTSSVQQWKRELLEKTTLTEEQIGQYAGDVKQIKPVTIATYQMLTYKADDEFIHLGLFQSNGWGLVIYDEVHLLPAPVFRATASIQSTRRLGLTATLVREDQREEDVFSLVGPKRYEVAWKQLEDEGYIATAICTEVRVEFDPFMKERYYLAPSRQQVRIAQENPNKISVLKQIMEKHRGAQTLVIGQYLSQLEAISTLLQIPLITGKMKNRDRERLYEQFRQGNLSVLAVSKVANFAIDLPDAQVAIQLSGTYGSRQEEAQRLGRILRPKQGENYAYFYHIVTKDSKDQEYAAKRQLFLIEQGYRYRLMDSKEVGC